MESLQEAAKLPANSTEPKLFQNKLAYTEDNDMHAKSTQRVNAHTLAINVPLSMYAPATQPFSEHLKPLPFML